MEMIKSEHDIIRVLLFEQVEYVDLLNIEQKDGICAVGTLPALLVAEEQDPYGE